MRGCLFFFAVLLAVLAVAVALPLGSVLSFSQAVIVWLLLVSVLWTAHAAWTEVGPLQAVIQRGEQTWVFAGLPERDEVGAVLQLELAADPPRVTALTGLPDEAAVVLVIHRTPSQKLQLEFLKGERSLWKPPPVPVGQTVHLPDSVIWFSRLNPSSDPVTVRFLDR